MCGSPLMELSVLTSLKIRTEPRVNSTRYMEMLRRFFIPELYNFCTAQDIDPFLMHFMQDGAIAHVIRSVQDYLLDESGGRTIREDLGQNCIALSVS